MKINRLFEIIYLLLDRKKMTAQELAEHFEVSQRTILRDIDALSQAQIPIYTSQGKGGGIGIMDHYVLNKTFLSEAEQNEILYALQSVRITEQLEIDETLSRIGALFQKGNSEWVKIDFARWSNKKEDQLKFKQLKEAILEECIVTFSYASTYGKVEKRKVVPLQLVFKAKEWYLQAYSIEIENYRTFKLNRLSHIEVLDEKWEGVHLTIPELEVTESPALIHLTFNVAPEMSYRIYDEFGTQEITTKTDGSLTVETDLPEDQWLYDFLFSLGTKVSIYEPKQVKERMKKHLEEMLNYYS